MKKKQSKTLELCKKEYFDALERLRIAESNFQNSIPECFELANAELTAARMRVDATRNILKKVYYCY